MKTQTITLLLLISVIGLIGVDIILILAKEANFFNNSSVFSFIIVGLLVLFSVGFITSWVRLRFSKKKEN
jgi:hypothetical protein